METHGACDALTFADECRANMKFTPVQVREFATYTRFRAENLEKVLRLREVLTEFHKHAYLKRRLSNASASTPHFSGRLAT
jgi:hypothetical protein